MIPKEGKMRDAFILLAAIVGLIADYAFLQSKSNGTLTIGILITLTVYAYFNWYKKDDRQREEESLDIKGGKAKYKLFFCDKNGNPKTYLRVETPFGTRSTSDSGFITVDPDELNKDEYDIFIFSADNKLIKSVTVVRANNLPVVKIIV